MNVSDIDQKSLALLEEKAPITLARVLVSPVLFVLNLLVVLTIASSKDLRNKSQFLIMSHSISEMAWAVFQTAIGVKNYTLFLLGYPATVSQLACMFITAPFAGLSQADLYFTAALAADRLMAIGIPIKFRAFPLKTYILWMNAICYSVAFVEQLLPFLIAGNFGTIVPVCDYVVAVPVEIRTWIGYLGNAKTAIIAGMYLSSILLLWRRYKQANPIGESQKSEWRRQVDFNAFQAITAIGIIFLVSGLVPRMVYTIGITFFTYSSVVNNAITYAGFCIYSASNLIVCLIFNSKFRTRFLRILGKKSPNAVAPLAHGM